MADLLSRNNNDKVTFGGIVYEVQQTQAVPCRDGKSRKKQVVSLVDDTFHIVQVTLWEQFTGRIDTEEGQYVEFRNMEIKDFRGKRGLSTGSMTSIIDNHDDSDAHRSRLLTWWSSSEVENEFKEIRLNQDQPDTSTVLTE